MKRITLGALLVLGLFATEGRAQEAWQPTRIDTAPEIDGVLDEPVWNRATQIDGFRTYAPDYGSDMIADTRVYMAYDDDNLYFAFVAIDPDPDLIKASVTSRDNIYRDDWVAINLDSFGDAQSLYAFYINPLGIQGDSRLAAGNEDRGVDLVWYSAGRIEERGYTAEVQIPFKSIRFTQGDPVRMGVIFERRISRNSQMGTAPELDPARGGQWATQMHPLLYHGVENSRVFELLPAATYTYDQAAPAGVLEKAYEQGDPSLTAKLGLTSDMVVDATYNPDFSQVEADAGQVDVNLRNALFYPEKRPFFLEGREHFGLAATGGFNPVQSVVYTRKIADPIAGTRLSGRIGEANTVASIYAVDELASDGSGDKRYAQVPIVRYKRALTEDSYLGGVYAGRETSERSNRVIGADGLYRVSESALLGFHTLLTRTSDSPAPSAPGAEDLVVNGHSVAARLVSSTRRLDWNVGVADISDGYSSDVGFFTRSGLTRLAARVQPHFFPRADFIRRVDVALSTLHTRDHASGLWESNTRLMAINQLFGSLNLLGTLIYGTEVFQAEEFKTSGYSVGLGGLLANRGTYSVTYSRQQQPFYSAEPFQGRSHSFRTVWRVQPSSKLEAEASLTAVDFFRDSDSEKVFDYRIIRGRITYQTNRYLFFRAISEYNSFREELITDFLASFTYIPGTVMHIGYGSLYDRTRWDEDRFVQTDEFLETKRRFFFKTSYLFRS